MKREIEILRRRALQAFETSKDMFNRGYYDWSIVMLEQAIQLLLKYYLAREVGYFSKTHELEKLFNEAGQLNGKISELFKENLDAIRVISDSYISGRYLPREYSKEDVAGKFSIFEKLREIIDGER
jgi:HEPN domain-containing protein